MFKNKYPKDEKALQKENNSIALMEMGSKDFDGLVLLGITGDDIHMVDTLHGNLLEVIGALNFLVVQIIDQIVVERGLGIARDGDECPS